jgi:hypothetical protein
MIWLDILTADPKLLARYGFVLLGVAILTGMLSAFGIVKSIPLAIIECGILGATTTVFSPNMTREDLHWGGFCLLAYVGLLVLGLNSDFIIQGNTKIGRSEGLVFGTFFVYKLLFLCRVIYASYSGPLRANELASRDRYEAPSDSESGPKDEF